MPRSPTGVYTLPAGNPVVSLTKIRTTWANPTMSDIATALTASWARNGEGAALANLPMGGFKFLNVDDATNATDFARADQVQTSSLWAVSTPAGVDDYTGNLPLGTTLFTEGQIISIVFPVTNTGDATLALNAGTANSIFRFNGEELFAGDIHPNIPSLLVWSDVLTGWILLSSDTMPFIATGSPTYNTGGGVGALENTTTGGRNTAFGSLSLQANVTGTNNSAFGFSALQENLADENVAMGANALASNTTGMGNTAVGFEALIANVTSDHNTAIGSSTLSVSTAGDNTAVGWQVLSANTTGTFNVGIGTNALKANVTGQRNVAIGVLASFVSSGADDVTAVGNQALQNNTASDNTAVGDFALNANTSGTGNTAIGRAALSGITTFNNCTGLGALTAVTGSNQVQLGDSATTTYAYGAVQNRSDRRDKAQIRDTELGLDFILKLRPRDFKWDYREDYTDGDAPGTKVRKRYHHGFIAQEVPPSFGGYQDHSIAGGKDVLSLGYQEFIAPLVKAIQELSLRVAQLEG